jgi:hypothetical protein
LAVLHTWQSSMVKVDTLDILALGTAGQVHWHITKGHDAVSVPSARSHCLHLAQIPSDAALPPPCAPSPATRPSPISAPLVPQQLVLASARLRRGEVSVPMAQPHIALTSTYRNPQRRRLAYAPSPGARPGHISRCRRLSSVSRGCHL